VLRGFCIVLPPVHVAVPPGRHLVEHPFVEHLYVELLY